MRAVIIVIVIIGLSAVIGAIVVGTGHRDPMVVDEPYEAGLKWDAERRLREELGWRISLGTRNINQGPNSLGFEVLGRDCARLDGVDVALTLTRPAGRQHDVQADVAKDGAGMRASFDLPFFGLWDLDFALTKDGNSIVLTERLHAEPASQGAAKAGTGG